MEHVLSEWGLEACYRPRVGSNSAKVHLIGAYRREPRTRCGASINTPLGTLETTEDEADVTCGSCVRLILYGRKARDGHPA